MDPNRTDESLEGVLALLDQLIAHQRAKVLATARRALPHLTGDDVLNPQDFPELSHFSEFHFEDGILAGYIAAQMAIRARARERS